MSVSIRRLSTSDPGFAGTLGRLLAYDAEIDAEVQASAASILADVRARGDVAVLDYTRRFDGVDAKTLAELEVTSAEMRAALDGLPPAQRGALEIAAARIRSFHERQLEVAGKSWSYRDADGSLLGQKVTPIDRVGIYVPGGTAPLVSTALMTVSLAKLAGVREIAVTTPPSAMRGRKRCFCASLPKAMITGPTMRRPKGRSRGAPQAEHSSSKMNSCTASQPVPPNSFDQVGAPQPCSVSS